MIKGSFESSGKLDTHLWRALRAVSCFLIPDLCRLSYPDGLEFVDLVSQKKCRLETVSKIFYWRA